MVTDGSSNSFPLLVSTPQLAALSSLFWPDLIEFNGCVALALNTSREGLEKWWIDTGGSQAKIQASLNHVHLYDYVAYEEEPSRLATLEVVAARIAECWRLRLRALYPGRHVDVVVTSEPDDYGPTVSFFFR